MENKIKYFVMDVDGTLTDGKIYMGVNGEVMKAFDIKDGYGIHDILIPSGVVPVILTGRYSQIVENRSHELGIKEVFQGVHDKLSVLVQFIHSHNSSLSAVAYIGDDLNDLEIMSAVKEHNGIVGCPSNASPLVKATCSFISDYKGGEGAVRNFIEYILNL